MSKNKPTPPPSTPPLMEVTAPDPLAPADREQIEKGLNALGYTAAVGLPLTAEAAQEAMLASLNSRLGAEAIAGETSLQALERIIREREAARADYKRLANLVDIDSGGSPEFNADHLMVTLKDIRKTLEGFGLDDSADPARGVRELADQNRSLRAAVQPSFDTLGTNANARGIIIHHVRGSGPGYDVGGRYGVSYLSVEDGTVKLTALQEPGKDEAGKSGIYPTMTWGTASDHLDKALEDFLRPKAHRS